jgi:hypothetical protein
MNGEVCRGRKAQGAGRKVKNQKDKELTISELWTGQRVK